MAEALLVVAAMLASWPGGTCPPDHFCAPTVGIYGRIENYYDPSGATDIGPGIVRVLGAPAIHLAGHAYTQFWAAVMLRDGDVVYAYGTGYRISGKTVEYACQPSQGERKAVALQTSLSTGPCGAVILVHAEAE